MSDRVKNVFNVVGAVALAVAALAPLLSDVVLETMRRHPEGFWPALGIALLVNIPRLIETVRNALKKTPPAALLLVAALPLLGGCPGCPVDGGKVVQCAEDVGNKYPGLVVEVTRCLAVEGYASCLSQLFEAVGPTAELIYCIVHSRAVQAEMLGSHVEAARATEWLRSERVTVEVR